MSKYTLWIAVSFLSVIIVITGVLEYRSDLRDKHAAQELKNIETSRLALEKENKRQEIFSAGDTQIVALIHDCFKLVESSFSASDYEFGGFADITSSDFENLKARAYMRFPMRLSDFRNQTSKSEAKKTEAAILHRFVRSTSSGIHPSPMEVFIFEADSQRARSRDKLAKYQCYFEGLAPTRVRRMDWFFLDYSS